MTNRTNTITTIAVSIFSFSIFSLCLAFFIISNNGRKRVQKANLLLCNTIYEELMEILEEPCIVAKTMASDFLLKDFLSNKEDDLNTDIQTMKTYLSGIKKQFGFSNTAVISAKTHRYYNDKGLLKIISPQTFAGDLWFNPFESEGIKQTINIYRHDSAIYINRRIEDDNGTFLGVSSTVIPIKKITDFFDYFEKKYNLKINTTDSRGLVNLDTTFSEILVANLSYLVAGKKGHQFKSDGLSGFYATYYIPDFDWYFVIRSTARTESQNRPAIFYLVAVLLLSAGILILIFSRRILHERTNNYIFSQKQIDSLTGLANRNYFKDQFGERGLFNTTAYKSLAVFDIDYFKEATDNLNGDEALISVVQKMKSMLTEHDLMLRWGGDEFVVLFDLSLEAAYKICKKFCKSIADEGLITISVGLTTVNLTDSIKTNYHRAARYCYMVKELGGNGVKKD